jgi:hypothetical protein
MLANKLNNLDSAASSFDLSLGRLAELMCFNRQGLGQLTISQDLNTILKLANQT